MVDDTFPEFYEKQKRRVDDALKKRLPSPEKNRLSEAMCYSVLGGGKRLRGVLVLESSRVGECDRREDAETLAATIECLHTYTLVHDDLPAMDDDDIRRGQPACHVHFDESTAILCGNALQNLAYQSMGDLRLSRERLNVLLVRTSEAIGYDGVLDGQIRDLALEDTEANEESILEMYKKKTGYLLGLALEYGALIGGLNAEVRADLGKVGRTLGIAFQIQDDLLEQARSSDQLGKSTGSDRTKQKSTLADLIGKKSARGRADQYINSARRQLDELPINTSRLNRLAQFIIERRY